MSFETSAELSLTVDEGDLANVKQQIEEEIGTTAVGVTDGGSMSAQATSSGGGRRARQSMRLAETRNEYLEDAVIYLEEIEDKVGTGGGGGGGGIFTEILGVAGETAGDVAVEAGDTVADALTDVLTGTAATALGNTIASAVNGSTVDVEPNPLPVEGGGGGGGVTLSPDFRPTFRPTFEPTFEPTIDLSPEFNLPDLSFGGGSGVGPVRVDESQLPLAVEDTTLPVEDVGPITVMVEGGGGGSRPPGGSSGSNSTGGVQFGGPDGITLGPGGIQLGGDTGITLGTDPGDPTKTQTPDTNTGGGRTDVTVTHSPTYNMEVDPRRFEQLADRIISELEDRVNRDIEEIRREVDGVEDDIAELERDLTSRSGSIR